MKNKTITYALLTVVLIIWGYICYKIYMGIKGDDMPTPSLTIAPKVQKEKSVLIEDFELGLNYRDPFLGKKAALSGSGYSAQNQMPRVRVSKPKIQKPIVVQEVINWEFLKFKGCIKNPSSNKMISMVQINNNQYMLAEGAVAEGVKVLKVYKDSVKVTYKNVTKTITR